MNTIKHLFTALLLLCCVGTATAYAFEVDGIYYDVTNDINKTVEVVAGYYSYTGSVVIPESVTYNGSTYSVTSIGEDAFYRCPGLTSITIPNSVTSIGNDAFWGCYGLTAVHISDLAAWCGIDFSSERTNPLCCARNLYLNGEKLTELIIPAEIVEVKDYAFYNCIGLTSIVIPNSVTSIGDYAFRGCSGLTSITIPNSITSIGSYAFYNCSGLTSVVIGNSVTSIGEDAFYYCSGLKTIYNLSNLTFSKGSSDNGYVADYADNVYNLPEGFIENDFVLGKVDGVNTLVGYLGNATELILPADYKGENYVIGASVFKGNTTIKSIVIPNSVTSIGESAFYGCTGLTSITIPNSVTSIGGNAFSGCRGLTSITIPNSVTSIGSSAFENCTGLTSIIVATGNANYDSRDNCNAIIETATNTLVAGCKNTLIPNSVTSIGDYAFSDCTGLKSITIPNSVTSIGEWAFYG